MQQLSNWEVQKKKKLLAYIYVAPNAKSCVRAVCLKYCMSYAENECLCSKGWYGDFVSMELKFEGVT